MEIYGDETERVGDTFQEGQTVGATNFVQFEFKLF